ncbi:MAG: mannose-1-phosphate guanylyltransferase/mannose-6-phosphate isomerase [Kiloniellaceae bacterium]
MAALPLIRPVILAGGSGVRLWPLSRPWRPKPFVRLAGPQTLLQQTVERFSASARFAPPLLVCNRAHRFLVAEQLQQMGVVPRAIVLEPVLRNTAPAAAIAALLLAEDDPDSLMLLAPSDHLIQDLPGLHEAIDLAAAAARQGRIVTFGAHPLRPETGYGYIKQDGELADCPGCYRIGRFVEKPDLATAERYLSSGAYMWNSGLFLLSAARLIEEMGRHAPAVLDACRRALAGARDDEDFLRLDEDAFAAQPSIPFDKAVMERTAEGAVVAIDIGWSDVGSWEALHQVAAKDADGNRLDGPVIALDSKNSYLRSDSVPLAVLGLEGSVVVASDDAILVCPLDRSQDLRALVDRLAADPSYAALVEEAPDGGGN